jgi:5'(3')-deoxyribonucleotidase
MKRRIGVDCDLTVCPSDVGWARWLTEHSSVRYYDKWAEEIDYNMATHFPDVEDPYQYWRELDYSQFTPIKGSVEKLKALSEYFDIVFISANKGTHTKSKYYWLKEHFPFMKGYMATKEKYLMNDSVVAMIDDRKDILKGFDLEKRVIYSTPYQQTSECPVSFLIESWETFSVRAFLEYYQVGDKVGETK